jgi:hypothetical protein
VVKKTKKNHAMTGWLAETEAGLVWTPSPLGGLPFSPVAVGCDWRWFDPSPMI